jgi:hypothetical protein
MHCAMHLEQTEGSCKQDNEIHGGGLIVTPKSSIHIMQLFGQLREGEDILWLYVGLFKPQGCSGAASSGPGNIGKSISLIDYKGKQTCCVMEFVLNKPGNCFVFVFP